MDQPLSRPSNGARTPSNAAGYNAIAPIYQKREDTVVAGVVAHGPEAYFGFTWFADSMTLVVEHTNY